MLKEKTLSADLCVVGGGISGICTAIAAARHGIKVVLMHERPVLGGNASSEIRMWICGAHGKNNRETGIIEEIMLESLYRNPTKNFYIWDSILLDFVRREQNITLLLNTTCMDADVEEGSFSHGRTKRITSVKGYTMTTQQFVRVDAGYFADCSGDSILAPLSDAEFMYGRESADIYGEDTHVKVSDDMVMGMSCLIQGRETHRPVRFIPSELITKLSDSDVENRPMNIHSRSENFWYLELGGTENTIDNAEDTKYKLVPLALGAWDYIKNSGKCDAENWDLEFLGFLPGKRESRRMKGEYVISQRDISDNVVFPDTVAFGGWPLDDHYPAGYYHRGTPNTDFKTPAPYSIPYRALYSSNVDNLFFAGRNISMTHMAMSSIRVMATCGLLGQAIGTAASIAAKERLAPHDVYLSRIGELQSLLMDDDCFLPHFKRNISPLCQSSTLKGGDCSLWSGEDRANRIYGTESCGCLVPNGESVEYVFDSEVSLKSVHIVFDSDLDRVTLPSEDPCENEHVTRANVRLDSPQMYLPKTLCRSFRLSAIVDGREIELLRSENNIKRSHHLPLDLAVTSLKLQILDNWGESDETNLISFDFC
ncbi:MAG: FAD-dependent oxidoreductase [Clostridia bacterium]|nr:FAD-dependent oxidoreductase [Clostridia bacterium]